MIYIPCEEGKNVDLKLATVSLLLITF